MTVDIESIEPSDIRKLEKVGVRGDKEGGESGETSKSVLEEDAVKEVMVSPFVNHSFHFIFTKPTCEGCHRRTPYVKFRSHYRGVLIWNDYHRMCKICKYWKSWSSCLSLVVFWSKRKYRSCCHIERSEYPSRGYPMGFERLGFIICKWYFLPEHLTALNISGLFSSSLWSSRRYLRS